MADAMLAGQVTKLRQRRTAPLILELDLTQGISEGPPADPVSALLARHKIRLADVLDGLRRARQDDRVKAVVAKVGGQHIGLATVQELWEAISQFRAAGKPTYAWAESFGEFSRGNLPYYLATAFDQIYLQPSGSLGLTGIVVEQLFLRSALDKIGVNFEAAQRQEYKTAAHPLTERGFTGPAREEYEHLARSVADQLTSAIAERRGKTPADARALLDRGPFLPGQALNEGLVDVVGYRDEVYAAVRKQAGPARSCSPSGATSGRTHWRSGPASCRAPGNATSPSSTPPGRSGRAGAAGARCPDRPSAPTRSRPPCAPRPPTSGRAPSCSG